MIKHKSKWSWRGKACTNSHLGTRIQLHTTSESLQFEDVVFKVVSTEAPGFSIWELLRFECSTECEHVLQDGATGVLSISPGYYSVEVNIYFKPSNEGGDELEQRNISLQWGTDPVPPSSRGDVDSECTGGPLVHVSTTRLVTEPTELRIWTCGVTEDTIDTSKSSVRFNLIT